MQVGHAIPVLHEFGCFAEFRHRGEIKEEKNGFALMFAAKRVKYIRNIDYPSTSDAYNAVWDTRREYSDKLGATVMYMPPVKEMIDSDWKHLAGFFDGDGSISAKIAGSLSFTLSQSGMSTPPVLEYYQKRLGGKIRVMKEATDKHKTQYQLNLDHSPTIRVLEKLVDYAILKRAQIETALQLGKSNDKSQRLDLKLKLQTQRQLSVLQQTPIDCSRISNEYVAGLLDAEGCILMSIAPNGVFVRRIYIQQDSSPLLLYAIRKYYGLECGSVAHGYIRFVCKFQCTLLRQLLPYMVQKRTQAEEFLRHEHSFTNKRRSQESIDVMIGAVQKLKAMKQI